MARYTAFPKLKPFDRDQDFIVKRSIKCSGKSYNPGDKLDKTRLTTRRLRQLYEQRIVVMVEPEDKDLDDKPVFHAMSYESLWAWLELRGVVPRYGSSGDKLVSMAERVWAENEGS